MKKLAIFLLATLSLTACHKAFRIDFAVKATEHAFLDCPVLVDLSDLDIPTGEPLALFEKRDGGDVMIPWQYAYGSDSQRLWFIARGTLAQGEQRNYYFTVYTEGKEAVERPVEVLRDEDALVIRDEERDILSYRTSEMMPPEGVDTLFKRSAYIHPLWSPGGAVLTNIQPPDHYHHYGIWGPWTLTHVNGREVDYWNLGKGEGTVRFGGFNFIESGALYGLFSAKQDHIDFGSGVPERVNIKEDYFVRYWRMGSPSTRYIVDIRSAFRNVLEDTIVFDAYRYGGGIGYRATAAWDTTNSRVLTSEGKTRADADGTRAKWCIIQGTTEVEPGNSGILFLDHPSNREFPEPMRVWPPDSNGGQLFFEFCPIRHNGWTIVPQEEYALQYRLVVFDGEMTPEEAEMYWNDFVYQPEITFNH